MPDSSTALATNSSKRPISESIASATCGAFFSVLDELERLINLDEKGDALGLIQDTRKKLQAAQQASEKDTPDGLPAGQEYLDKRLDDAMKLAGLLRCIQMACAELPRHIVNDLDQGLGAAIDLAMRLGDKLDISMAELMRKREAPKTPCTVHPYFAEE
jgi:hypothetical protein